MTEEHALACTDPSSSLFTPAEQAALSFANKFATDHYSIGELDLTRMSEHFSNEEIVEIGMLCAQYLGFGRLVRSLGIFDGVCEIPIRQDEADTAAR